MSTENILLQNNNKIFNYNNSLYFKVGKNVNPDDINIAYYKNPELLPKNNTTIINSDKITRENKIKSDVIPSNFLSDDTGRLISRKNNDIKSINTDNILITDIKSVSDTGTITPLFYKYTLKYKHIDIADYTDDFRYIKDNLNVLDKNKKYIDDSIYKYKIFITDYNFNGYESEYDITIYTNFINDKNNTFYIDYNCLNPNLPEDYLEIINAKPVFIKANNKKELSIDDPDCKKYYLQKNDYEDYNIYVPVTGSKNEKDCHDTVIDHKLNVPVHYNINANNFGKNIKNAMAVTICSDISLSNNEFVSNLMNEINSFVNSDDNNTGITKSVYKLIEFDENIEYIFPNSGYAEFFALTEHSTNNNARKILPPLTKALQTYHNNYYDLYSYQKVIVLITEQNINDNINQDTLSKLQNLALSSKVDKLYIISNGSNSALTEISEIINPDNENNLYDLNNLSYEELSNIILTDIDNKKFNENILEGYFFLDQDVNIFENIDYLIPSTETKELTIEYTFPIDDDHNEDTIHLDFYDENQNKLNSNIKINENNNAIIKIMNFKKYQDKKIFVGGYHSINKEYYTRDYFIKTDTEKNNIYSVIDNDLKSNDNWYLNINNGKFIEEEISVSTTVFSGDDDKKVYQIEEIANGNNYLDRLVSVTVFANYPDKDGLDPLIDEELLGGNYYLSSNMGAHIGLDYIYPQDSRMIKFDIKRNIDQLDFYKEEVKILDREKGLIEFSRRPYCGQKNIFVTYQKGNIKQYHYSIPEYKNQNFTDKNIFTTKEDNVLINNNINLKNEPLYINTSIDNETGIIIPDNIATSEEVGNIINWNESTGDIYFAGHNDNMQINVQYKYKSNYYKYKGYYDEDNNFIHLDLNPRKGHTYKDPDTLNILPTKELLNKTIYLYLKPEFVTKRVFDTINKKYKTIIVEGSRKNKTLFHTINKEINDPLIKLVSKIYIHQQGVEDYYIYDTRTRGGGIKDWAIDNLKEVHDDINCYWDIGNWDGTPYPKNAVVVIELPKEILDKFSEKEVEKKINKHLALGVLPVIRYI